MIASEWAGMATVLLLCAQQRKEERKRCKGGVAKEIGDFYGNENENENYEGRLQIHWCHVPCIHD